MRIGRILDVFWIDGVQMLGVGVPNSPDVFNLHTNMYTRVLGQGDRCGWLAMASKETPSEIGVLSGGGFDSW